MNRSNSKKKGSKTASDSSKSPDTTKRLHTKVNNVVLSLPM